MKKLLLVLSVAIVTIISCSKKMDPVVPVPPETLKSIALGKDTLTLHVGDVKQLGFTLSPSDYNVKLLVFTSSDSTVVSVTNAGLLTAKKSGLAIITIANQPGTISVSFLVSVLPKVVVPPVDSLKVGLIAFYPFSFDSAVDSSGNGNNGTIYDITSVPDRFGKVNSAYYFNGMDSYIDIKDNQVLRLNNTDFSINYWVNLDQYISSSGSAVLSKNNGSGQNGWNASITGYGFAYNIPSNYGHAFYNVSGGPDPFAFGKQVIATGTWTMVTLTYSVSKQQISFYINGILDTQASNIPTPNPNTAVDLLIGKNSYNDPTGYTPSYFIQGKLDDIRMYKRLLSSNDIQKLLHLTY